MQTPSDFPDDNATVAPAPPSTAAPVNCPANVPGYRPLRLLGRGAYGEVWVAIDANTGGQVAIKVFSQREGLNEALLSREVEKLVQFSADRHVVQLLKVGWDANPPYYVMEYVEGGSLEDKIQLEGRLSVSSSVEAFRDIAIGLSHAHRKGILHCDLKPANILLDQDQRPRLADFGQSRLTKEQRPALGTLFYMAPEQASLDAIPDTRWDIYALGAIMYAMLVGSPPHRSDVAASELDEATNLRQRLQRYQHFLKTAPAPANHRNLPGMDRELGDILDRCLAVDPEQRYPHVEGVLQDLQRRDASRARKPLLTLGILGPALLLLTMIVFGWRAYRLALRESNEMVLKATRASNQFAADGVAKNAGYELATRFEAVAEIATQPAFIQGVTRVLADPLNQTDFPVLRDPHADSDPVARAISRFRDDPARLELQRLVDSVVIDPHQPADASWLVIGPDGTMLAAGFRELPAHPIVGESFAYRSYFHGGPKDLGEDARPPSMTADTQLSAVFRSTATNRWKVAISTPIRNQGQIIGILAMTVELGNIVHFQTSRDLCALLVDGRESDFQGVVLQHPLFDQVLHGEPKKSGVQGIPARFLDYRVHVSDYLQHSDQVFRDPFAADELGGEFSGDWIAGVSEVAFPRLNSAMVISSYRTELLIIVQSRVSSALAPVFQLSRRLVRDGMAAIVGFIAVAAALWAYVWGRSRQVPWGAPPSPALPSSLPGGSSSLHDRETMVQRP